MSAELDQRMIEGDMVSQVLREPDHGKDFGFESEEDGKSSRVVLVLAAAYRVSYGTQR